MPKGVSGVRAAFADATAKLARAQAAFDPPPYEPRVIETGRGKGEEIAAGQWPGAPRDRLPPGCPVVPLGVDGKTAFFVDSLGQLIPVTTSEWGKKVLLQLFCMQPNYVEWAWPRWGGKDKAPRITGVEVDDACQCLLKAAGARGLFSPADRVRGRGAWSDEHGRLIWHAGDRLFVVDGGRLKASPPGEIDEIFYSARPLTIEPWPEPVRPEDSPARGIFEALKTWSWERPALDPLVILGALGVLMIGGALVWRPHLFIAGDRGTGKSELQKLIKGVLGATLHDTANASEAGVRQRLGLDTLPIAVDEMEASADNRRVTGIIDLARISSSGGRFFRGGADHKGVEFQARSAFLMTAIIPPPMGTADKSRFVVLDLDKLGEVGAPPSVPPEAGRMMLRALMDAWPQWEATFGDWRATLKLGGLERRQQDTYGTLLAMAQMLLGFEGMDEAGLPIEDAHRLGRLIAAHTAGERGEQIDNWRACLEHLLGSVVDAWKGGEKPTVGSILAAVEQSGSEGGITLEAARARLASAGLGLIEEEDPQGRPGHRNYLLAVPRSSPALARLYQGSKWADGGWWISLKQGRSAGRETSEAGQEAGSAVGATGTPKVIREGAVRAEPKAVKINRVATHCLLVDLGLYDALAGEG